jgi:hypothetical protein
MIYIGFSISVDEAVRLLKMDPSQISSSYDTAPIQTYLKEKGSALTFASIDKGACVFGLPVCNHYAETYQTLDECIAGLQETKRKFQEEIETLKINTSEVNLISTGVGEKLVKNPQGYLIDT